MLLFAIMRRHARNRRDHWQDSVRDRSCRSRGRKLRRIGFVEHGGKNASNAFRFGSCGNIVERPRGKDQRLAPDCRTPAKQHRACGGAGIRAPACWTRRATRCGMGARAQLPRSGVPNRPPDCRDYRACEPFRSAEPALVMAKDTVMVRQMRDDAVPGIERAADLVQEDDAWSPTAFELVMKTDAVRVF